MSKLEEAKIANRYAKALFDMAQDNGNTDKIFAQLSDIKVVFDEDDNLLIYLTSPNVTKADKIKFTDKHFAGKKIDASITNLLKIMLDNSRIQAFPALVDQFQSLLNGSNNVATAKLITADSVTATLTDKFSKQLKKLYGYDEVEIENIVKPEILGGAIIQIQDQVIDGSYATKLRTLSKQAV